MRMRTANTYTTPASNTRRLQTGTQEKGDGRLPMPREVGYGRPASSLIVVVGQALRRMSFRWRGRARLSWRPVSLSRCTVCVHLA